MKDIPACLKLREDHWQVILAHVLSCLPEEGCGLLGGRLDGECVKVESTRAVTNELRSPVRFRMAPEEQLKAFRWLEEQSHDLVAIYHSHPSGPEHLSPTDLAEFAYPGVLSLILAPTANGWQARAFWIAGDRPVEVPIDKSVGC